MDRRLFDIPIAARLLLRSSEQAAWINIATPTVYQAKADATHLLRQTQCDIREFLICPAQLVPAQHAVQIDERQPIPRLPALVQP
jgi:hypothetical protein